MFLAEQARLKLQVYECIVLGQIQKSAQNYL